MINVEVTTDRVTLSVPTCGASIGKVLLVFNNHLAGLAATAGEGLPSHCGVPESVQVEAMKLAKDVLVLTLAEDLAESNRLRFHQTEGAAAQIEALHRGLAKAQKEIVRLENLDRAPAQ